MPDLSDIYTKVTQRILADLERGVRPWQKPWQDRPGIEIPTGAVIKYGANKAAYSEKRDIIYMPEPAAFMDHESYYATLVHELTHNADTRIMPRRT